MKRMILVAAVLAGLAGYTRANAELTMDVVHFDGESGHIELPREAFSELGEATFEVWVKWEAFGKNSRVLDFRTDKTYFKLYNDKKKRDLKFAIQTSKGKKHDAKAKKSLELGTWHHIAAVCGKVTPNK